MLQAAEEGPRKNGKGTDKYVYKAMQVRATHDNLVKKRQQKKQDVAKLEAFQAQKLKRSNKRLQTHRFV